MLDVESLFDIFFKPGIGPGVLPFLNKIFFVLFCSIVFLWLTGVESVHVYVLGFLSFGLFSLINWFVAELRRVPSIGACATDAQSSSQSATLNASANESPAKASTEKGD
eukprot:EC119451.1.p1 GENE.EC119451.1~~EC119451.1.p1  ORF type:complete len:109 (+),score=10.44 EC119451.1:148-474(+)